MHLDEEVVQRLLDGELSAANERAARAHLETCADCRRLVAEAGRVAEETNQLLRTLDHPLPSVDAEAVAARAGGRMPELVRVAAALAIGLTLAAGAYAIPGSPLPRWLDAVVGWIAARPAGETPAPQAPSGGAAGIAVLPGARFVIEFAATQTTGGARVSITDEAQLTLRVATGSASFDSEVDRLVVDNRASTGIFEIGIPRAAPRVEIRIRGVTIFRKQGAVIDTRASQIATDSYDVSLTHVGP